MLSSRCDMAVIHSSCGYRHTLKPNKKSCINERGDSGTPSLAEEILAIEGCWGRESHFSLKVWSLVGPSGPLDDPTPMPTWEELMTQ